MSLNSAASRARRLRHDEKTFGFLARLVPVSGEQGFPATEQPSRECACRRDASNARQSTSIRLDYLSTFTNQHRSRAKKRLAFGVKSSTCVYVRAC